MVSSVLDRLSAELIGAASAFDPNTVEPPVALFWPDRERQWEAVIPHLGEALPLLTFGEYDPSARSGPAYWLRCVIGGTIEVETGAGPCPIVYLPGVAREDLRSVESCPSELAPLAGLQYRSQWFSHPNGRDWTVAGFLGNKERGLGASVSPDAETAASAVASLGLLAEVPVSRLEGQFIDAKFFNDLLSPDPRRALLDWLDDPAGYRERIDTQAWAAFCNQCRDEFGFDPEKQGEIDGALRLGRAEGTWAQVWERFREAPASYPRIPERLRVAKPQEMFSDDDQVWPQDNDHAEAQLRDALSRLAEEAPGQARQRLRAIEQEHRHRRGSVWAELGQAPLAFAAEHLDRLAGSTWSPVTGDSVAELVAAYADGGWQGDDAAVQAIAAVKAPEDRVAVEAAVEVVYRPWVQESATLLQAAVGPLANGGTYPPEPPPAVGPGVVVVFVDGLRLDLAHRLAEQLEGAGATAAIQPVTAALPTVTETAKPTLIPVPDGLLGPGPDLAAARAGTAVKASASVLRSVMGDHDVQVLAEGELGDPSGSAWTETGKVDHQGHDLQMGVVDRLDAEVDDISTRVRGLLDAGWREVVVVTDHGWLLMPGGLPKTELPKAVTECKKGRAARLKDGASVEVPTVPWHWDPDVRIAVAPGIYCFEAGKSYEHGGVSLQECVVPRMTVTAADRSATRGPEVVGVKWLGLRCRVEVRGVGPQAQLDLRTSPADAGSSLVADTKATTGEATVSLIVPDEEHEGQTAYVVVLGVDGELLAQREVTVGVNT